MRAAELKRWRSKHLGTQRAAAAWAGVNVRTWRRWECGDRPVPRLVALAVHGFALSRLPPLVVPSTIADKFQLR